MTAVLRVSGLTVDYRGPSGPVRVVRGVGFELYRGRVLGLVGESGSGKSTAALAAIGVTEGLRREAGASLLDGDDLCALPPGQVRRVWGGGSGTCRRRSVARCTPHTGCGPSFGRRCGSTPGSTSGPPTAAPPNCSPR
ncbi:ATP-binding cassette domain-containing protein [Phytohabitans flavus]|uniref:ATP-binding cassette domain-containing protein n=1 Tax=Phytohabitans flavus TaxID=1076124 RepID=UPI001E2DE00D|nr:ATP-binding cassette domain-containing protein [Phytohabitans flavus]